MCFCHCHYKAAGHNQAIHDCDWAVLSRRDLLQRGTEMTMTPIWSLSLSRCPRYWWFITHFFSFQKLYAPKLYWSFCCEADRSLSHMILHISFPATQVSLFSSPLRKKEKGRQNRKVGDHHSKTDFYVCILFILPLWASLRLILSSWLLRYRKFVSSSPTKHKESGLFLPRIQSSAASCSSMTHVS